MVKIIGPNFDYNDSSSIKNEPKGDSGSFKLEPKSHHLKDSHYTIDSYVSPPGPALYNDLGKVLKELDALYKEIISNRDKGFGSITPEQEKKIMQLTKRLQDIEVASKEKKETDYQLVYQLPQTIKTLFDAINVDASDPRKDAKIRVAIDRAMSFLIY